MDKFLLLRLLLLCVILVTACAPAPPVAAPAYPTPLSLPSRPLPHKTCEPQSWNRPHIDSNWGCLEVVFNEVAVNGIALVGALAFGDGDTLYVARPAAGAVTALDVAEGGSHTFAEDLVYPFGVAYYQDALYVAGRGYLYRLRDIDGDGRADDRAVLVDDLPVGGGYWANSVGVGPDGRLYVAQGGCDRCDGSDLRRGAILSYAMDGSDERVIASGLHNPMDFTWHPATGDLWVTDSRHVWGEPIEEASPDLLSRVVSGELAPAVQLGPGSAPAGLAFYRGEKFPEMQGHLVMVTYGSWNVAEPRGYELLSIVFGAGGLPTGTVYRIAPASYHFEPSWLLSEHHSSFFPEHPVDVVVGPDGLLYISVQEGLVVRVRPV